MTNSTKPVLKLVGGSDLANRGRQPRIDVMPSHHGWCLVDALVPVELAHKIEAMVQAARR